MSTPKTLTTDQSEMIIEELLNDYVTEKKRYKALRNATMAMVMLETGIRVGELCGLRFDDVWYGSEPVNTLVIRKEISKNKKERQIPISKKLYEALKRIEEVIWSGLSGSNQAYAFFNVLPSKPLSTRTVERIILDAGKKCLNMEVTPHMLRHTFGSMMMRKANARVVQALLGHESLQSTQIYMHPNSEDLRKAIDGK
jgi:site-specific recombinase XerD